MANHVNRQLREAVQTALTGLPTTGARVHSYRVNPLESGTDLPALMVRAPSDVARVESIHAPPIYARTVDIVVLAYAAANADLDDVLDTIRKEVEAVLGATLTVSGVAVPVTYQGSAIDFVAGERPAGELEMRFTADLYHSATAPDVLL